MKSPILFLAFVLSLILVLTDIAAFGQGPSPFWESLPGPAGPIVHASFLSDSIIGQQVGGTIYILDTSSHRWVPRNGEQPSGIVDRSWRFLALQARYWLDDRFAGYKDSLFSWVDSGHLYRFIGTFGSGGENSLQFLLATDSRLVLVDDLGRLISTADTFRTVDTSMIPEPYATLFSDGDTLYLASVHGNFLRSADFGKSWSTAFDAGDTATNWHVVLWGRSTLWALGAWQRTVTFPYVDTNVFIAYSVDRGRSWIRRVSPVSNHAPFIEGIDRDGRIFVWFDVFLGENYRSDDSGRTWRKLPIASEMILDRNGVAYSGNLFSSDHGETWDTIVNEGVSCVPVSLLPHRDTVAVSSLDYSIGARLSTSYDDGESWSVSRSDFLLPGVLSHRPDSTNWIMVNTTQRLYPSGGSRALCWYHYEPREGIGCITRTLKAWVVGQHYYYVSDIETDGSRHDSVLAKYYMLESSDTGCSYYSFPYDTLSPTPITQVMESGHDTILAVSRSGIYRGFDILTPFDTVTPEPSTGAMPTGAMMKDSLGAIYVAMSDGKIFVTSDDAMTWRSFATPTDARAPITSLASVPNGKVLAVDSNLETGFTRTWLYDPEKTLWIDVTYGLKRAGFSNTAIVTNVWYVNDYAYAGTWNMGLFRSHRPVTGIESVEAESHSSPYKLYPNPAGSTVTFTYPAAQDNYEYRLMDITGNEIAHGPIPRNSTSTVINLRSIASGHYEVTFNGWLVGKLVVKR